MRSERSTRMLLGFLALILGKVVLSGCGASSADGVANSEEQRRYRAIQKLGGLQTKDAIAEKRKQGLAEIAQKKKEAAH